MCGIAGFFGRSVVESGAIEAMTDALRKRGPDAEHAVFWDGGLRETQYQPLHGLIHTRLSIRDPRPVADQPMCNAKRDVWICYNGEVYGWEYDAQMLQKEGYRFNTRSDTEFILNAYQAWGMKALTRLRGKFAFVIVDLTKRKVFAVRDRLGIKPLVYYYDRSRQFACGSLVRSVLPYLPARERRFSPASIDAYLAHRYVPAPHSIYDRIERLPAAHYLSFDLDSGALDIQCYWDPATARREDGTFSDYLQEAVHLRTVSDRPLGLFLSGGVDSAAVASVLARAGQQHITAFTAAFPGTAYDEAPLAAKVANHLGLRHERLVIDESVAGDFERIIADLDEPFADPSSFPLWYLAQLTTQRAKVVLGGDGGDELLGGYKRYAMHLRTSWRDRIGLRVGVPHFSGPDVPRRRWKLADEARVPWLMAYSLRFSGMGPALRRFLQPGELDLADCYWQWPATEGLTPLEKLISVDVANYLPEYVLRKADLCTMAHGLELRAPLLDHMLYERLNSMPIQTRFTTPPKQLLNEVCSACQALDLWGQPKRGFNPPVDQWLRGPLAFVLEGLPERLARLTDGQIARDRSAAMLAEYGKRGVVKAEQVLQLVVLERSLNQLAIQNATVYRHEMPRALEVAL